MHSLKREHQSPELKPPRRLLHSGRGYWISGYQVLMDTLHPHSIRESWWSPPVLGAVKIFLAYVSSGIRSMWPNRGTLCLDNGRKAQLLSCASLIIIPHMVVPFDS